MEIMQGDQYSIPFVIDVDGETIDSSMVEKIEIVIGKFTKEYPGEVTYKDGAFLFPLEQTESMTIQRSQIDAQVRVKFKDGDIIGTKIPGTEIQHSLSKEML